MAGRKRVIPEKPVSEDGPISSALRRALKDDGRPILQIAKLAGIEQSQLYRIADGSRGCTTGTLDKLAPVLRLRLVSGISPAAEPVSREDLVGEIREQILAELEPRLRKIETQPTAAAPDPRPTPAHSLPLSTTGGPPVRFDEDEILAVYRETGNQSETARRIGCSQALVSKTVRKARNEGKL